MKIPEAVRQIKGKNPWRDFGICKAYIEGQTPEEIQRERHPELSLRHVQRIISRNAEVINPRIAWPKSKRIAILQKMIGKEPTSKKDAVDILEQLRKEVEGEKPLIDNSKHTHVIVTTEQMKQLKDEELIEHARRILPQNI